MQVSSRYHLESQVHQIHSSSLDLCKRYSPSTRKGSFGLPAAVSKAIETKAPSPMSDRTYWSFAICFIPSSRTPVTFPFKYFLVGAPCGGASLGMVGAGSGCCEVALEVESWPLVFRTGVPVRRGAGLGAFVIAPTAGDYTGVRISNIK